MSETSYLNTDYGYAEPVAILADEGEQVQLAIDAPPVHDHPEFIFATKMLANGIEFIDLRIFFPNEHGQAVPTSRGITIPVSAIPEIVKGLLDHLVTDDSDPDF